MAILGAHTSIAGGLYKAVQRAADVGCDCVQIFTSAPQQWPVRADKTAVQSGRSLTKNNNQWRAKELADEDVARFRETLDELKIGYPIAHNSYLINMASPKVELWKKSIDAMVIEMQRADRLGLMGVVAHPGSYTTSDEQTGLKAIIRAIDEVHRQTPEVKPLCLLETTAGQGSNLGWQFEHLATILEGVKNPDRLGVCFDTCHVLAAGYPLSTEKDFKATMAKFNKIIGVKQIKAFHLNDSKRELGSRVDRHEQIGKGHLGKEAFRLLLNDRRFRKIPMYLETPKEDENGKLMDPVNLKLLRSLIKK